MKDTAPDDIKTRSSAGIISFIATPDVGTRDSSQFKVQTMGDLQGRGVPGDITCGFYKSSVSDSFEQHAVTARPWKTTSTSHGRFVKAIKTPLLAKWEC